MIGLKRVASIAVLACALLVSFSQSEDGGGSQTNLFHHTTNFGSHHASAYQHPSSMSGATGPKISNSRSGSAIPSPSSSSLAVNESSKVATARQSRSHGWGWGEGGGHSQGGGWGWGPVQTHYVHSPSHSQGYGSHMIIGALACLGILALLGYLLFSRFNRQTIVLANLSGRRRRAVDDFDDGLEGESLPELMTRLGGYFESAWTGYKNGKSFEPFKLPSFEDDEASLTDN